MYEVDPLYIADNCFEHLCFNKIKNIGYCYVHEAEGNLIKGEGHYNNVSLYDSSWNSEDILMML